MRAAAMTSFPEDLPPLLEALAAGHAGRGPFVATGHDLKEQHRPGPGDREAADLIDNCQGREAESLEAVLERAGLLRLIQGRDQFAEGGVVDPAATFDDGDGQTQGQMRRTDAGRAEEDDALAAVQKAERVEAVVT